MEETEVEYGAEAPRLVKLRLPAPLVRALDRAIAGSKGAYLDRNEYVAEAIRDRLLEEGHSTRITAVPDTLPRAEATSKDRRSTPQPEAAPPAEPGWGEWLRGTVPTLAVRAGGAVSFGLHNRDLPSLWALDRLAAAVTAAQRPVPWDEFVPSCAALAVGVGAWFAQRDATSAATVRAAVGFPRPGAKARSSAERFVSASIGSRRGDGPFFLLGLGSFDDEGHLAPTAPALGLLGDLIGIDGFGTGLPHPPGACRRWFAHLAEISPEEEQVWRKLLKVVTQEPTRLELIAEFPEWSGSQADTNSMGFISRSREWGLVEPNLIDGRYRLTPLGQDIEAQKGTNP